jgi:hypothetical protein
MTIELLLRCLTPVLFLVPALAIIVTPSLDAAALTSVIAGPGVTISNPKLTFEGFPNTTAVGFFTAGANSVGFEDGIVLTTGTVNCIPGPNDNSACFETPDLLVSSTLSFNFTTQTGNIFFNYVFGSEEYTQYVGGQFNDAFELRLDGTNIAVLPPPAPPGTIVSINSINCGTNPTFYRNNVNISNGDESGNTCPSLSLDIQYDGLTTVLTASAINIGLGSHFLEFFVTDVGDSVLDSGVFIQSGSLGGVTSSPAPEPTPAPTIVPSSTPFWWWRRKPKPTASPS